MSPSPLCGRKLLIVEDDPLNAQLLTFQLEDEGLEFVGPAASVDEALALCRSDPPDLVLLDYRLRGATVEPVVELLQGRGTPFVLATGALPAQFDQKFPGVKALLKPFTAQQLIDALRSAAAR